jgi:hypothetical protein
MFLLLVVVTEEFLTVSNLFIFFILKVYLYFILFLSPESPSGRGRK